MEGPGNFRLDLRHSHLFEVSDLFVRLILVKE